MGTGPDGKPVKLTQVFDKQSFSLGRNSQTKSKRSGMRIIAKFLALFHVVWFGFYRTAASSPRKAV
jgi:hypothetical protein